MAWWVEQRPSGIPRDPGQLAYAIFQAATRTEAEAHIQYQPGATIVAGPFPTEAAANKWIQDKTGSKDTSLPGQAHAATGPIKNPLPSIGEFISRFENKNLWLRVGEVVLGLLLIAVGVAKLTDKVGIATKVAKVLK